MSEPGGRVMARAKLGVRTSCLFVDGSSEYEPNSGDAAPSPTNAVRIHAIVQRCVVVGVGHKFIRNADRSLIVGLLLNVHIRL